MSVYVMLVAVGEFADYLLGRVLDQVLPALSLPIFLTLFFLVIWAAWPIAVRLTEPRTPA